MWMQQNAVNNVPPQTNVLVALLQLKLSNRIQALHVKADLLQL